MNMKKIMAVIFAVLLLATAINYFTGTTIIINGKHMTGVGGYMAAYLALVLLAAVLIIVIPSTFILIAVLLIGFAIFSLVFFPLLPIALLLLPGAVFAGIVYLIYKWAKKKK